MTVFIIGDTTTPMTSVTQEPEIEVKGCDKGAKNVEDCAK